ncbi:phosphopantothenoylcysteine decarboxylase domain-containing protein, partial [Vibrio alfacsensis]
TQDVEAYALDKLQRKNLDMICANDVSIAGQGFNSDSNAITVYWQGGSKSLGSAMKTELSHAILEAISEQLA